MNNIIGSAGFQNPNAPKPQAQPPGDPDWPRWFYPLDGGPGRVCQNERQASELCPGWSTKPIAAPPKPAPPVAALEVQDRIDTAVLMANAELQSKYDILDGKHAELEAKYKALVESSKVKSVPEVLAAADPKPATNITEYMKAKNDEKAVESAPKTAAPPLPLKNVMSTYDPSVGAPSGSGVAAKIAEKEATEAKIPADDANIFETAAVARKQK